MLANMAMVMV